MAHMTFRQAWKATVPRVSYKRDPWPNLTFYTVAIEAYGWGVKLTWHRRTR